MRTDLRAKPVRLAEPAYLHLYPVASGPAVPDVVWPRLGAGRDVGREVCLGGPRVMRVPS